MDTRIYVMTHKSYTAPSDDTYISLHVGRAQKPDLGYIGDDTGDNISYKNKNYCELTGIYWIWKNVKCDIAGVCHYRRFFIRDGALLKKDYIEKQLEQYDIIVPDSSCTRYENVYKHYEAEHHINDLLTCREVLQEKYPEYITAFDLSLECNFFSIGNMLITRKDIFDKYCEWLFDILFEVEKRVDISGYDDYQARIMGFLSERLFRVWLMGNEYRIREETVKMLDLKDSDNGIKLVQLKYKYISLILNDMLDKYNTKPVLQNDEKTVRDVCGGRLPIWVCWWQGIDNAPELVKMCFRSLINNIPSDRAEVILITFDNYMQYIDFPENVINKFNSGMITLTHLSDILRMGLLARYGGMWIDATYYMAGRLPEYIINSSFYTQKFAVPMWQADIVQGRWSCNLIKGEKGNLMFRFVFDALCRYWEIKDEVIDYYLFDYIIAFAYDHIRAVHDEIAQCPVSEPNLFALAECMDLRYDDGEYRKLTSDTTFFKLSYKTEYQKKTAAGQDTFYGHLLKVCNAKL